MIGHLQRNKVAETLPLVHCIQSLDSLRLARQIETDASKIEQVVPVLLEVNVSQDRTKTGLPLEELIPTATEICQLPHLRLDGLMGMASLDGANNRSEFALLRQWKDRLQSELGSAANLDQLSMGMSGDFEEAILEGATIVRIGSLLLPASG